MMEKYLFIFLFNAQASQALESYIPTAMESANALLKIKMDEKKLRLKCEPKTRHNLNNTGWVLECNHMARKLMLSEAVNARLQSREVEEMPFGRDLGRQANYAGSNMHKKTLQKSFKLVRED